jgi:hypothetical protein
LPAAPAFEIVLRREPAWLFAAACVGLLAALASAAWAADGSLLRWIVPGVVVVGMAAWCATAWRRAPQRLRWDGQDWGCGPFEPARPAAIGRLTVAVDIDAWLLLRFEPTGAARRSRWIAASRPGLGAAWPALRRAVYCARPSPTESAGSDSSA